MHTASLCNLEPIFLASSSPVIEFSKDLTEPSGNAVSYTHLTLPTKLEV